MNIVTYLRLCAIVLCSFIFTASYAQKEEDYFITVWDLSLDNKNSTNIEFASLTTGDVNYTWETFPAGNSGSGMFDADNFLVTIANLPAKATIRLKLEPQNLKRFYFEYRFDRNNGKLIDVTQWGKAKWLSMELAFFNCGNLDISTSDLPHLDSVQNMSGMFSQFSKLKGPKNINQWEMKNVKNISWMFGGSSFNQPIDSWNTQNVTNMGGLFSLNTSFNQPIGNWNTQNVIDMGSMFFNAANFNQSIDNWNIEKVANMSQMFGGASSFNQPIGSWNTQNVTNMSNMFTSASSFNQRLDSLEFNPLVILGSRNIGYRLLDHCGIDCKNYSNTLIGWANNTATPTNIYLVSANGLKYRPLAKYAREILTKSKRWTISGDVLSTSDCGVITGQENEISPSTISLYPNPAQDKLFLKNAEVNISYKIIDNLGRTLKSGICQSEEISIADLPSGLYKLVCENKSFTFVKE